VVAVRGETATVELDRSAACGGCRLCSAFGDKMRLDLPAIEGLEPGQRVVVGLTGSVSMRSVLLLFGLPLVGLVAGALLGQAAPIPGLSADATSAVLAFALLAAAFGVALLYERTAAARSLPHPTILRMDTQ
jgi:positive regulator of sigma E activity